jgi:Ca-activated chloride channel homolog
MNVRFASPLPVHDLQSPSHPIEITQAGQPDAALELGDGPQPHANRDFILHYRLGGERTATGLTLWQGPHENYFLAVVEPPKVIPTTQINPREYVFVVDISGSMHGYPLSTAKTLLRNLIGQLRPSDTFNVLLFSGSADMLNATPVPATRANVDRALQVIDRQRGGGSTEIVPALKRIAALPKPKDVSRTVVVVTDGYVTVEQEVFALVRKNLGQSNVFAFGIGHSVNRHLIEGIARAGQGEAFVVTKPEHAAQQAERLRQMIDSPVLTDVRARFEGLAVYDVASQASPSDGASSTLNNLPDVLGGRPVVIVGKWRGDLAQAEGARLIVQGQSAAGSFEDVVKAQAPDAQAVALEHLWARQTIAQHLDQDALEGGQAHRAHILALGLKHHLLTPYTSFLAVDQLVRTRDAATPVDQPVPLPQGVGPTALSRPGPMHAESAAVTLGAEVPSTPEPTTWLALTMVVGLMGLIAWRRQVRARDRALPHPSSLGRGAST